MKFHKIFFVALFLFVFLQCIFAQEIPKAELLYEMGKPCSEELMARYDGFYIELNNNPTSTGYIVFFGDENLEGRNLSFAWYLKQNIYPQIRKYDASRIKFLRSENQAEMKIQFWVVPAGADPPQPEKEFVAQEITSTTLFDKNYADFHTWYGSLDIYSNGFLDLGCDFKPNVRVFAERLLSNSELTGYLVVYTKFGKGKKYGNRIASFAVVDLMNNYKVPRNRLKTIYGGNREEPEIELWFVPKGNNPPIPKPDTKPK